MRLRERFGRPLRLAVVGGGPDSWIGRMHRGAAEFDGWWRVVAGVFSSDAQRSRAAGALLGIDDPTRSYGSVAEMIDAESKRPDRADAIAIMSPNDTHHPYAAAALDAGFDVVCDKPVTTTHAQALDLVARVRRQGRLFAIAHGYSAYPMTRHARELVRGGALGAVRFVQVEYVQSALADARRGRTAHAPPRLGARPGAQRPGAGDERDRLPCAAPGLLRRRCADRARGRGRRHADAGAARDRPCVCTAGVWPWRARHLHRDPGRGRCRERTSGCASSARRD